MRSTDPSKNHSKNSSLEARGSPFLTKRSPFVFYRSPPKPVCNNGCTIEACDNNRMWMLSVIPYFGEKNLMVEVMIIMKSLVRWKLFTHQKQDQKNLSFSTKSAPSTLCPPVSIKEHSLIPTKHQGTSPFRYLRS